MVRYLEAIEAVVKMLGKGEAAKEAEGGNDCSINGEGFWSQKGSPVLAQAIDAFILNWPCHQYSLCRTPCVCSGKPHKQ